MTMDKRQPSGSTIPQWGAIASGPLKGWRFAFLQLVKVRQGVHIDLRCTQPNWPFPTDVRFNQQQQKDLVLLAGPRARLLEMAPMVKLALEHGYVRAAFEDRK